MKGVGLLVLMVAAFVAMILFLKTSGVDSSSDGSSTTPFKRIEKAEEAVDIYNKAAEERLKELENIE